MEETRPTTHENNGGEQQPVDVETQQFTTKGGTSKEEVSSAVPDNPLPTKAISLNVNGKLIKGEIAGIFGKKDELEEAWEQGQANRYNDEDNLNPKGLFTLRNFKENRKKKLPASRAKYSEGQMEIMRDPKCVEHIEDIIRGSCVCSRTKFQYLENILKDSFKNQFQFEEDYHTGGSPSKKARAEQSMKMFGTNIGDDPYEFQRHHDYGSTFEKYGSLLSDDKYARLVGEGTDGAEQYGRTMIEFKPSIKRRTTYCLGDSLGSDYVLPQLINGRFDCATKAIGASRNVSRTKALNAKNIDELRPALGLYDHYIELQMHGKVTADDIDNITARSESWRTPEGKRVAKLAKEKGIKIFSVDPWKETISEVGIDDNGNLTFFNVEHRGE